MSPDGKQVLFWKYAEQAFVVNWEGGEAVPIPVPSWDANGGGLQSLNRFSSDGSRFLLNSNPVPGIAVIVRPDGSERFEPLATGRWDGYENTLFWGAYAATFSADLRRCVTISEYWAQRKPRQVVVADIDPTEAPGIPVVSDIEFPPMLSTNRQVPQHRGTIKARITKADSAVERVQFLLAPVSGHARDHGARWFHDLGWQALQGSHLMNDAGIEGDETAGDGVYTSDLLSPDPAYYAPPEGRYHLRIVAHDDQNAVIVDVDGVDIR
jgi:hypothetical protein